MYCVSLCVCPCMFLPARNQPQWRAGGLEWRCRPGSWDRDPSEGQRDRGWWSVRVLPPQHTTVQWWWNAAACKKPQCVMICSFLTHATRRKYAKPQKLLTHPSVRSLWGSLWLKSFPPHFLNFMQITGGWRRSSRQEMNVRGICEEVSDTPASYHANYTVNVIIGKTNLAGGNYRGKADNFWCFSAHRIVFNGALFPLWMPNNNVLLMNQRHGDLETEKVTWYQRGWFIKTPTVTVSITAKKKEMSGGRSALLRRWDGDEHLPSSRCGKMSVNVGGLPATLQSQCLGQIVTKSWQRFFTRKICIKWLETCCHHVTGAGDSGYVQVHWLTGTLRRIQVHLVN